MPRGIFKHKPHTEEWKARVSQKLIGNKNAFQGARPNRLINWDDPIALRAYWKKLYWINPEKHRRRVREWCKKNRHEKGISKRYRSECCKTLEERKKYKKLQRQKYKYLKKNGGELSIKTIQMAYEDNIKKYGTLTCYLCLNPIEFRKDHLEHRIPLSRGGTNEYKNLAIACQKCNCKKHAKTEEEYRKENLILC